MSEDFSYLTQGARDVGDAFWSCVALINSGHEITDPIVKEELNRLDNIYQQKSAWRFFNWGNFVTIPRPRTGHCTTAGARE